MPSYNDFVQGVTSALDHVRKSHSGHVLIARSGGPISTAVGHLAKSLSKNPFGSCTSSVGGRSRLAKQ